MKSMMLLTTMLALPTLAKGADPSLLDPRPLTMTRKLSDQCARLERRGPAPWFCGRREQPLTPPFAEACPDRAWVGYRLTAGACLAAPSPLGTWTVTAPFERSQDARLQRLCRYTWSPTSTARPEPDVAALPDVRDMRMERDCQVVSGHAAPPQAVADELFGAWSDQLELPDWSAAEAFGTSHIRVAVIDGGVPGEGPTGAPPTTVDHPTVVSSVIRAVNCPDRAGSAVCAGGAPGYNALPYVLEGVQGELGGFFGTQGDFAQAVDAAVNDWVAAPPLFKPAHLILNLSLGWDGDFDVTQVERVPAAAALWAAEAATCAGALLVAASGNQAGDSDTGPLFPAAWEVFSRGCGGQVGVYSPLVHAVGAVDGRDEALGLSRLNSAPRLVAPASIVVVPKDTGPDLFEPTVALSGTSLAAAATSGAAALIWSMRPSLTPDEVMAALYDAAEPLGVQADFGLGAQPGERRRLSVARAFALACPEGIAVEDCPAPASRPVLPAARGAFVPALADFPAIVAAYLGGAIDVLEDPNLAPPAIPSAYYSPYVVPQPGEPNCPICGFTGTTLNGKLSDTLFGVAMGQPIVQIIDADGFQSQVGLDPIPVGQTFKIDLFYKLNGIAVKSAWLEIPTVQNGKNVLTSSELYVN